MTGTLFDPHLDLLERRFQALRDQLGAMSEGCRHELEGTLQELSQAIAALRADRKAGGSLGPAPPGGREVQAGQAGKKHSPMDPEVYLGPYEAMLRHVFDAIPDLFNVIDPDLNILMSNWHGQDLLTEMERCGQVKCHRLYWHRDRPCEDCQVLEVFATGRPVKVEKFNPIDDRVREIHAFPIKDESGRVVLVAEYVRDITDRHLAEQALKQSEATLRTLIKANPESLFLLDTRGVILAASHVAARRLGKSLEEIIGTDLYDTLPPEVSKQRFEIMQGVIATGQPARVEDTRGDFYFDSSITPIFDQDKVVQVAVLGVDITDRKHAEEALRKSEALFRAIFATAQDTIFIKDRSLRYIQVNPAIERLFGRPAAEIIGKTDSDLVGAADTERIRKQDRRVLNGEVAKGTHIVPVQGVPITFHYIKAPLHDAAGEIVGICGIARDITDLKRAEAALEESEERFRMLFEHAPDAYILADMQGEIIECNQAAEELAGYGRKELIGNNFACLPWLDFRQQVRLADLLAQAARGEVMGPVDFTLTRKDGGEVIAEGMSLPLYIQGQNLVLTIVRDITARKQAEEALRESEARFRALFENAPVGISTTDLAGRLLQTNRVLQALLGYTAEELRGREASEIIHPEDRPESARLGMELLAGNRRHYSMNSRLLREDGEIIWGHVTVTLLRDARGEPEYFVGTVIDITAQKQAEEALRESETRYRMLFEAFPDAISLMDIDMKVIMENPCGVQLFGSEGSPEGTSSLDFVAPEDRLRAQRMFVDLLETGETQTLEITMGKQDGSRFPCLASLALVRDVAGRPQAIIGIARDITALKQAEAELRQSEHRFRLMAETIQDVFWIAPPDLSKMVYVSPAYEQVWGRTCQELYQSPWSFMEAIHPEDRERVNSDVGATQRQKIPWSHEYRIIRPDGAVRWIQDRGYPVRDDQGRVILFTGVATDITEHKALEQQLLQAQKMEAVGRLAGGVAHDFNNLLMAITGYGELMRAKVLKEDPLYGHLENILKAGERASALTQQLLTFSRQQIIQPQVIDLNRVVLDLEPMLRRLIGEDLHLEVVTDRRPGVVKADPGQMGQIILNLVVNARDAMPQGGRLTLKTAAVDFTVGCHSRFGPTPPGPYVRLAVQDTGVGMGEATMAHIFEPFFTTKEPGKGTGLGLSTVYGIVKQSGGYLDLASEPGVGSTFTIYLPRLEAIVEPPKAKIPITASFQGEETILLVEDEDMLRGLLAKFLRIYGYTVLEARHGGEALLTCERHPGPIHLMVTDVVMPQMSGRELADRLTPLHPEMKILYMSGYTEDALVQHGVAELSVAFLQKPFRPIELARRVHAVFHPPVSR
jgi:PAS domain S-box-containing protein